VSFAQITSGNLFATLAVCIRPLNRSVPDILLTIRERFGVKSVPDYLVGEKLLNFASEADRSSDFAAELPRFQAAVWDIFNPYEFTGYLVGLKPSARRKLQKLLYVSS